MKPKLLDLFSGIGGFSLGLEAAGYETAAFCEINAKCRHLLAHHWPGVPAFDDITTLTGDQVGPVDAICGGFPCQDISFAGKGAGITGERSGLWRHYARLIGELRPRNVFVENVAALLGRGLGDVLAALASLGYDAWWDCIPAAAVGAPHRRDRLWLVAYPRSLKHQGYGDALRREIAAHLSRASVADADIEPPQSVGGFDQLGSAAPEDQGPGRKWQRVRNAADGSCAPLANAARQCGCGCGCGSKPSGGCQPANCSPAMADAHVQYAQGLVASITDQAERSGSVERPTGPRIASLGGLGPTQSRMGRMADGLPAQLDRLHGGWAEEPDTPRVAVGVPARVARLHGLGNAVVPQIPQILGRAVLTVNAIREEAA